MILRVNPGCYGFIRLIINFINLITLINSLLQMPNKPDHLESEQPDAGGDQATVGALLKGGKTAALAPQVDEEKDGDECDDLAQFDSHV